MYTAKQILEKLGKMDEKKNHIIEMDGRHFVEMEDGDYVEVEMDGAKCEMLPDKTYSMDDLEEMDGEMKDCEDDKVHKAVDAAMGDEEDMEDEDDKKMKKASERRRKKREAAKKKSKSEMDDMEDEEDDDKDDMEDEEDDDKDDMDEKIRKLLKKETAEDILYSLSEASTGMLKEKLKEFSAKIGEYE